MSTAEQPALLAVAPFRIIHLDIDGCCSIAEESFATEDAAQEAYSKGCEHAKEHGGHLKLMHGLECVARYVRTAPND